MGLVSKVMARIGGLPPAETTDVVVERDLETKMPDGAVLLSDHWFAPDTVASAPIILLRSPYGRRQLGVFGRLFSERGYQVVIQSCRGTFGSGGSDFDPFHHERADGVATLAWLADQAWFTGNVATYGPSYLGLVQWAVASSPPPYLRAMAMQVTTARVRDIVYPGGSFALETGATWVHQMHIQERSPRAVILAMILGRRRINRAYTTLPLSEADLGVFGVKVPFYQDWLVHDAPGDPWWDALDWSTDVGSTPPSSMIAGWYDLFLPGQLEDFRRLREAGREVRLTIGPWTHASPRAGAEALRDGLEWFDTHLRGRPAKRASDVRLFVGGGGRRRGRGGGRWVRGGGRWVRGDGRWVRGGGRWVDLDSWPPPHQVQRWHLQPGGRLSVDPAGAAGGESGAGQPDTYRFDPADPAPGLGGPSLDIVRAGRRNQRRRESRPDVLTYTSGALGADLTVAGPVNAEVWVRCSNTSNDVFVRLCDVYPSGKSYNVCDGIVRIDGPNARPAGADGSIRVSVPLWPTAVTFARGHRVRVQVSSAAHPLYARNPGSGEPLGSAATLRPGVQEVFHDEEHPSAIELPVSPI